VTTATPLGQLHAGQAEGIDLMACFLGNIPGCIGETSALALLLGGFAITFGGVVAATAIMLIRDDDDTDGGRSSRLQPVPLRASARARR